MMLIVVMISPDDIDVLDDDLAGRYADMDVDECGEDRDGDVADDLDDLGGDIDRVDDDRSAF